MYFIFDCFGNIVGNPRGYRTYKGARIQANTPNSTARKAILDSYAKQTLRDGNNLVSQIRLIDTSGNKKQSLINHYIGR